MDETKLQLNNMEYLLNMNPQPPITQEMKDRFIRNIVNLVPNSDFQEVRKTLILSRLKNLGVTKK